MKKGENPGLLIVGASTRAAAWSALRAGFAPWCADLFGDRDLRQVARTRILSPENYPGGLSAALEDAPQAPLLYTGALENRPGLVRKLADKLVLWGNGPEVLRRVRSPFLLAQSLQRAGLPHPQARETAPQDSGRWLLKPRSGAAGIGIRPWQGEADLKKNNYFQEWIEGVPCSALYLGGANPLFLGVTRQLIAEPWLHAGPFRYCGSVGPLMLSETQRAMFERLGQTLVQDFGLRGLFGVDCVLRDGVPWPVEVNPRYTASVEILELASGLPILALHGMVFDPEITLPKTNPPFEKPFLAKGILFAKGLFVFPGQGPWEELLARPVDPWRTPAFADLPDPGQAFAAGQPILTLFSRGMSAEECVSNLQSQVREIEKLLYV
jgi:predicted ATP-grasp superfamily ATP-dependent carboligase